MKVEIVKTENGWSTKDKDDGEYSFESDMALMKYLMNFLPCDIGCEVKLTD